MRWLPGGLPSGRVAPSPEPNGVEVDDLDLSGLSVSVVIPTLNEAANLPHVLPRLPTGLHEVIIVDGNSVDDTVEVASRIRPDIKIVAQMHKGKGDAVGCGIHAATGDVIALIDADGSTDPAEIPRFVAALADGADFATGSRYLAGGGSADLTWYRSLGCRLLSTVANLLFGTKYTDINYGYNVFRTTCLDTLHVDATGFELEALLNVRAAKLGFRVAEVPSFEGRRVHGMSNLRPIRDGFRVLRLIVHERFAKTEPRPHEYFPGTRTILSSPAQDWRESGLAATSDP
jgi:glycosyltransferase involved in cell wall biosynthesis